MGKASVTLTNNLPQLKGKVEKAAINWLEETTGELEAQVKRGSRSDGGGTANSWSHEVDTVKKEGVVGSDQMNAIWEEYGTGEFAVNGDGRGGAWYVPVESATGSKKPSYNGKVIVVHGKNGKKYYKTNGKQPHPALEPAWSNVIPKAKKNLPAALKKIKP